MADYRKQDKEDRKITHEDVAEYMAKKAQKKFAKVAKKLKLQYGCANDSNLNEIFVWKKKIEHDIAQGVPLENFSLKAEKKRKREIIAEIEKVKKRREQRAIEKTQREEEIALLGRKRDREEFRDWEKKEAEFQFKQSKIRSEIRLREGRMKPIDMLANQLHPSNDLDIESNGPYMVLTGLDVKEMEELHEDIKLHLEFDTEMRLHKQYWEALLVLCDWELTEVRKKDALDRANGKLLPLELLVEERKMHSGIEIEVKNLLQGQTYGELEALQSMIEASLCSGAAKVVEFWEAVLKRIPVFKAKAFLKDFHAKMLPEDLENPMEKVCSSNIVVPEVNLDSHVRKPKYLNRVRSGYEWNKYNQTHYDHENPPPKSVKGYKFNIFYPDLLDKSKVPTYVIEKNGHSTETCIIRFHAGAPYEDIAFRIVNKEWELSGKKGFKCTFERGILQLYFNLKPYRYRR